MHFVSRRSCSLCRNVVAHAACYCGSSRANASTCLSWPRIEPVRLTYCFFSVFGTEIRDPHDMIHGVMVGTVVVTVVRTMVPRVPRYGVTDWYSGTVARVVQCDTTSRTRQSRRFLLS